jgi:hypothetical protein
VKFDVSVKHLLPSTVLEINPSNQEEQTDKYGYLMPAVKFSLVCFPTMRMEADISQKISVNV